MKTNHLIPVHLHEKYWLISADMGYGHQRAVYPLKVLSRDKKILTANLSPKATPKELKLWKFMSVSYEFLSKAGKIPVLGVLITQIFNRLLDIPKYNPSKDGSKATLQVKYLKQNIKKGFGRGVIEEISNPVLPIITSFYSLAIAAEMAGYSHIFCIICDADINRVWASEDSSQSWIIYFVPATDSARRLISYGVPEKSILLTGFPLPLELLGDRNLNILKANLSHRLNNLDPQRWFYFLYKYRVYDILQNEETYNAKTDNRRKPVTITYAVGGTGVQMEIGKQIVESLKVRITGGKVKINLVAGIRAEVRDYFNKVKTDVVNNNDNVQIIWADNNESYFDLFNHCLQTTDILWTKPSELSFYCALGMPIIMAPAVGPQEKYNQQWLLEIGAGIKQQNPKNTDFWLFELINKGRLAEAAWNGFMKARKYGTYNILDFLETGTFVTSNDPLKW